MKKTVWGLLGVALLASGAAFAATAAEDDLAVVKKAVAVEGDSARRDDAPVRKAGGRRPQWLKVRVTEEKEGKKEEKVSVTLPLGLLAALGKDASVDLSEMGVKGVHGEHQRVRIMDLLETLEPGSLVVEVRDENSHVRVWVE
jgi:hypothetical protein